ncbi:MAG: nitroreductase family protein [Candidatus Riflebacteria bacterium]|nr:nitroreductase family protein [Candidatus Riflebacteria bacterium]
MDLLEGIHTRRSVRVYKNAPVDEAKVNDCLAAAMAAPSAGNQQPWQFVVIADRTKLDAIPGFHPYAAMVKKAPLAIVVCGDLSREKYKGFWVQDCSAATQNLLLAAHAMGLGAVWCGLYPDESRVDGMRKLLGLPETVVPLALIPIGWPSEACSRIDRFDAKRVHHDGWTA